MWASFPGSHPPASSDDQQMLAEGAVGTIPKAQLVSSTSSPSTVYAGAGVPAHVNVQHQPAAHAPAQQSAMGVGGHPSMMPQQAVPAQHIVAIPGGGTPYHAKQETEKRPRPAGVAPDSDDDPYATDSDNVQISEPPKKRERVPILHGLTPPFKDPEPILRELRTLVRRSHDEYGLDIFAAWVSGSELKGTVSQQDSVVTKVFWDDVIIQSRQKEILDFHVKMYHEEAAAAAAEMQRKIPPLNDADRQATKDLRKQIRQHLGKNARWGDPGFKPFHWPPSVPWSSTGLTGLSKQELELILMGVKNSPPVPPPPAGTAGYQHADASELGICDRYLYNRDFKELYSLLVGELGKPKLKKDGVPVPPPAWWSRSVEWDGGLPPKTSLAHNTAALLVCRMVMYKRAEMAGPVQNLTYLTKEYLEEKLRAEMPPPGPSGEAPPLPAWWPGSVDLRGGEFFKSATADDLKELILLASRHKDTIQWYGPIAGQVPYYTSPEPWRTDAMTGV